MPDLSLYVNDVKRSMDELLRQIELYEKMKNDTDRLTKSAKRVEELKKTGKFVRYKEGKAIYGISEHKFMELAKDAGAVYKLNGICLVNTEIFEKYLETFRIEATKY